MHYCISQIYLILCFFISLFQTSNMANEKPVIIYGNKTTDEEKDSINLLVEEAMRMTTDPFCQSFIQETQAYDTINEVLNLNQAL
jgi:hypothetical protein